MQKRKKRGHKIITLHDKWFIFILRKHAAHCLRILVAESLNLIFKQKIHESVYWIWKYNAEKVKEKNLFYTFLYSSRYL